MRTFAMTGGIATGKTTAGKILRKLMPSIGFFDCDKAVQGLLKNENVLAELSDTLGESIVTKEGTLDRPKLRALVFGSVKIKSLVEDVLHPKVRKECLEKRAEYSISAPTTLFVADVPLLFESGFDFDQELNLVVATSAVTQRIRLKARSQFEDRMISSILEAQLPISEKIARGDVVFWNEGSPAILEKQLERFLNPFFIS